MSMNNKHITLVMIILFQACLPKLKTEQNNALGFPKVNFCDLPKYAGQTVFIRASYSGIEEYWSLKSISPCKPAINVELDDVSGKEIPKRFQQLFDSAHHSYWNTYLIVELTGIFENKNPNGYGHLGSNKARFIVSDYVSVRLAKR
jgi:hypothetical protein